MPRGRSYRRHKQAVRKMQVEREFHNAAKLRRKMAQERHTRAHLLHNDDLKILMADEARYEFQMRVDRLESKIENFYRERIDEVKAFQDWKAYNEKRLEARLKHRAETRAKRAEERKASDHRLRP